MIESCSQWRICYSVLAGSALERYRRALAIHLRDAQRGTDMKRVLISAIAVAALASPVLAADLPVKAPAYKAPPPAVYSWTGCYIAGGGTYGLWDQRIQALDTAGNAAGLRNDNGGRGWGGTAQVGC